MFFSLFFSSPSIFLSFFLSFFSFFRGRVFSIRVAGISIKGGERVSCLQKHARNAIKDSWSISSDIKAKNDNDYFWYILIAVKSLDPNLGFIKISPKQGGINLIAMWKNIEFRRIGEMMFLIFPPNRG